MLWFIFWMMFFPNHDQVFEGLWRCGSRGVLFHIPEHVDYVTVLSVVDAFDEVSSMDVGSLCMSRNRGTLVGLYIGLLTYVVCSVSMEVPFFF